MAALSHVKSNTIADFTGTVTNYNSAGVTQTVNATDLVRPGDWNSAHNFFQTISGNTSNLSTASGTNLVFQGGNNITLSMATAAGAATMVISGPSQAHSHSLTLQLTNLSGTFSGDNNGMTLSLSGPAPLTLSDYEPNPLRGTNFSSLGQNSLYFQGLRPIENVSMTAIEMLVSMNNATSATASHAVSQTLSYGIYSKQTGASTSQYALQATSSFFVQASGNSNTSGAWSVGQGANSATNSSTNGIAITSQLTGQKVMSLPFATSLSAGGDYLLCFANSTTATNASSAVRMSFMVNTLLTNGSLGVLATNGASVSAASITHEAQMFIYSATSAAWPSTIANTQVSINSFNQLYAYLEA